MRVDCIAATLQNSKMKKLRDQYDQKESDSLRYHAKDSPSYTEKIYQLLCQPLADHPRENWLRKNTFSTLAVGQ